MKKTKTKTSHRIYVRDDNCHAWFFEDGRIRCVLAELDPDPENKDGNGYPCANLEEGIRLLNEYGYITGYEYDAHDNFDMRYFTAAEQQS